MDEQVDRIKEYLELINDNFKILDRKNSDFVDFVIYEIIDRVQLYLNSDIIPEKLERIIAKIVNTGLKKSLQEKENSGNLESDAFISSISDNGQSISYTNEAKKYFANASDEELFSGFTSLLNRYRRVKVVYSKNNE